MKRYHSLTKPTAVSEMTFEDLYEDISHDWEAKAKRLQSRRWRELKHQTA